MDVEKVVVLLLSRSNVISKKSARERLMLEVILRSHLLKIFINFFLHFSLSGPDRFFR